VFRNRAYDVAKLQLGPYRAASHGQPVILHDAHVAPAVHREYISDVLSCGPLACFIDQVGIAFFGLRQILQRALGGFRANLAHPQHIGLPHQDEDLDRSAHVRSFVIRLRQPMRRVYIEFLFGPNVAG
jgi:hypothetical protein